VERGEFLNAGVIVWCLRQDYLAARVALDVTPAAGARSDGGRRGDLRAPRRGAADLRRGSVGGPVAQLPPKERFHWLVAPRSTVIQTSPVHAGRAEVPEAALARLFKTLVEWGT
jgi:hypothetical protein